MNLRTRFLAFIHLFVYHQILSYDRSPSQLWHNYLNLVYVLSHTYLVLILHWISEWFLGDWQEANVAHCSKFWRWSRERIQKDYRDRSPYWQPARNRIFKMWVPHRKTWDCTLALAGLKAKKTVPIKAVGRHVASFLRLILCFMCYFGVTDGAGSGWERLVFQCSILAPSGCEDGPKLYRMRKGWVHPWSYCIELDNKIYKIQRTKKKLIQCCHHHELWCCFIFKLV